MCSGGCGVSHRELLAPKFERNDTLPLVAVHVSVLLAIAQPMLAGPAILLVFCTDTGP